MIELSEMECFSDNIDGAADAVMVAQAMIRDEMTFSLSVVVIEVVVERGREDGVDIVRENRNTYSWVDICLEIHGPEKSDAGA